MPAGRIHFCGISYFSLPILYFVCHISYFLFITSYLLFLVPFLLSLLGAAQVEEGRCQPGREHFLEFLWRAIILEASKKNQSPEYCHALKAIGKKTNHIIVHCIHVSICTCHAHKADGSFMILRSEISSRVWKSAENNVDVFFAILTLYSRRIHD